MSSPDSLTSFGPLAAGGQPVASPLPIENVVEQLFSPASRSPAGQQRLRLFQRAYGQIVGELSLVTLLQRITDLSREVVGARYAALGVVGLGGQFDRFLHSGVTPAETEAIGEPPKGRGLLAMMIEHPKVTRLSGIASHPRSGGLPVCHPAMDSFLGVPIWCRGALYAVLYLTEQVAGRDFDSADQELAEALVGAAGIAIENALLHEESCRRQDCLRAAAELSRYLLGSPDDAATALRRTLETVQSLLEVDTVALLVPADVGPHLTVLAAGGDGGSALLGRQLPTADSIAAAAMRQGCGLDHDMQQVSSGAEAELKDLVPMGPMLALPLSAELRCLGAVLAIRRPGRPPFTQAELEMAETFAGQAAVALQLVEARGDRHRLTGMEQRDEIARALHRDVVQRLFGIGTDLQLTAQQVRDRPDRQRLLRCVEEVDETVQEIRSSIFSRRSPAPAPLRLSGFVPDVVEEVRAGLGLQVELELDGPLDWPADSGLVRDIEAVLRESLTNVSKYAHTSSASVRVRTDGTSLELTVADDGVGLQGSTRRSGLDNLGRRAERYGGQLAIDDRTEGGLALTWAIPL